jgi:uncharacterized protein YkwD
VIYTIRLILAIVCKFGKIRVIYYLSMKKLSLAIVIVALFGTGSLLLLKFQPNTYADLLQQEVPVEIEEAKTTKQHFPVEKKKTVTKQPITSNEKIETVVEKAETTLKEKVQIVVKEIKKEVTKNAEPLKIEVANPFLGDLTQSGITTWSNKHRSDNGLSALARNSALDRAAKLKAQDMLNKQYFAHVGPDGKEPSGWVEDVGYNYRFTGENLAAGDFGSDKELVQGWMDSPGHRANILGKNFTEIGVGVLKGTFEGRTQWLAVQVFGKPMPVCDSPDNVLSDQISANEVRLDELKLQLEKIQSDINSAENIDEHNKKVDEYNSLLPTYNSLGVTHQNIVDQYNADVEKYNICIKQ